MSAAGPPDRGGTTAGRGSSPRRTPRGPPRRGGPAPRAAADAARASVACPQDRVVAATSCSGLGKSEAVAHLPAGVDERRAQRVKLLAQVADVGLEDVGIAFEVVLPHVLEDLHLGEDPAGIEHEVAQEVELGRGQVHEHPAPPDLTGVLVENEVGELELGAGVGLALGAAQDGPSPGDELLEAEGLGDVVVPDRKSTRLNSSHRCISYAVFCLKKKKYIGMH